MALRWSVVIPAYNEEKLIAETVRRIMDALRGAGLGDDEFEVIVSDNASNDRTAALAAGAGARVVFEPLRQIARARNTGAAAAIGEWLLFVDADSHPDVALISDLFQCVAQGRVVTGGSTVRMRDVPASISIVLRVWNAISRRLRWAAGSFVFCRADVFHAVGGFNLDYYVGEEIEFSMRVKRWARPRGHAFAILRRHPLLTSGRKGVLYRPRELWGVFARMVRHPRRFFRDPRLCYPWYDGRR